MEDKNTNQTLISQSPKPDINNAENGIVDAAQELGGVIVQEYTYEVYQ